ncbi:MAG TPA: helix-turn-helix domain-containing protein [Nitrospirales bacterium]|nr:hypothetical protein [Nitrospiraceae bacterium]HNP27902.1 helix-turn-helix domain-containing protein [Nitrospirales bacterium]
MAVFQSVNPTALSRNHDRPLLSSAQAAEFLGVSMSTMNRWRWLRSGPPFRRINGRTIRYALKDLENWSEQALVEPVQQ